VSILDDSITMSIDVKLKESSVSSKGIIFFIIILFFVSTLQGCTTLFSEPPNYVPHEKGPSAQESPEKKIEPLQAKFMDIVDPEPPKIIDIKAPVGSRKNPIPIGSGYIIESTDPSGISAELKVGIVGVIRGKNALRFIQARNVFDMTPNTQIEYILPLIYVENVKDLTGNDYPYYIDESDFEIADAGYSNKKQFNFIVIGEPYVLDANLYEGSVTIGVIPFEIPKKDEAYLIFNDIWFWLGTEDLLLEDL